MKELLENIFTLFNLAGIRYVVLRNYDYLPDRMIDGDIDVLVDPQGITEVTNMLRNMDFVITEEAYPHYFALHFQETSGEWLKLDLVTDLYYGRRFRVPINGNHRECFLGRRQPFRARRTGPVMFDLDGEALVRRGLLCQLRQGGRSDGVPC